MYVLLILLAKFSTILMGFLGESVLSYFILFLFFFLLRFLRDLFGCFEDHRESYWCNSIYSGSFSILLRFLWDFKESSLVELSVELCETLGAKILVRLDALTIPILVRLYITPSFLLCWGGGRDREGENVLKEFLECLIFRCKLP